MSAPQRDILIVDDDTGLRELLAEYLGEQGFAVRCAADGHALDACLAEARPDLIILDLMLPGEDGLSIARRLQADGAWPVIMISARGEDMDRIIGLEVGADDYLPKPFNPRELLARIRAVLRRHDLVPDNAAAAPGSAVPTYQRHAFGPFVLDVTTHRFCRDGQELALTAGEFNLLRVFCEHPNRVLSRDRLIEIIKGYERTPYDRSIDVRVTRLRRKIEDDPAQPRWIRTIWGEGYLFSPQGEAD